MARKDSTVYCQCGKPATAVRKLNTANKTYQERLCADCAATEDSYSWQERHKPFRRKNAGSKKLTRYGGCAPVGR